jgi:HEPN domain-containing protein
MRNQNNLYKEWIVKAQNDLETAEILLKEGKEALKIAKKIAKFVSDKILSPKS